MKILKTAVAGLGRIGWQFHIPSTIKNDGFELICVCDPLEERRREAEESFGVKGYKCFDKMLEKEKPDLAVIATPTNLHKEHATRAMELGCDVFLDKPIAVNLTEAEEIAASAKRAGRKLMVYQPHRATAETQTIKKIIASGVAGDIFMIKRNWHLFSFRNDWQAMKKFGGGMLNNYGAHAIDSSLYLAGSKAEKCAAYMNVIASAGDADDVVKLLIETENKICLDLDINMASAGGLPETVLYGSCGTVTQTKRDDGTFFYRAKYFKQEEKRRVEVNEKLAADGRLYHTARPEVWHEADFEIEKGAEINFYEKVYEYYALGAEPFVPVSDTMEVMRVIDECRRYTGWVY